MNANPDLHDPEADERLGPCSECHTLGTVDGGECGVCLGDGWIWKDPSAVPSDVTKYVDHSGIHHSCGRCSPPPTREATPTPPADMRDELRELVRWMDEDLDGEVDERYREQPLAQDWARVAKVSEEVGEAIDALIGVTGQNPRKGEYGSRSDLVDELADVALTGLYAMQHFVKNADETLGLLMDRARHHHARRSAQLTEMP